MGSITEFPGKRGPKKNKISDEDKKFLIEQFATMIENSEVDDDSMIDISVSAGMFQFYMQQFPCFQAYKGSKDFDSVVAAYDEAELSEEQDLAVECVLDLISDQYFDFNLKDAFNVWGQEDIGAFIKIVGFHAMSMQIEDQPDSDLD